MKTKSVLIKIFLLLPLTLLVANCNKSSDNSTPAVAGYYVMNGSCYVSGTQTATAVSNCQTGAQYNYNTSTGICTNAAGANVGIGYCTAGATSVGGFYVYNQACYASGTTNQVAVTNCQTGTVYYYQNGGCYNSSGTNMGLQYCTGTGVSNGLNGSLGGIGGVSGIGGIGGVGGYGQGQCNGVFYIQTYGGTSQVQCSAYNMYCRGAVVYTSSGQPIQCQ